MFGQVLSKIIGNRLNLIVTGVGLAVMHDVIEQNLDFINDLQRQQFEQGITSTGERIQPDYAPSTVKKKQKKGQPYDRVTVHDEGGFYADIFTTVFTNAFVTDSHNFKAPFLKAKYANLFGLTVESKQKLIAHIKPQYINLLIQRLKTR